MSREKTLLTPKKENPFASEVPRTPNTEEVARDMREKAQQVRETGLHTGDSRGPGWTAEKKRSLEDSLERGGETVEGLIEENKKLRNLLGETAEKSLHSPRHDLKADPEMRSVSSITSVDERQKKVKIAKALAHLYQIDSESEDLHGITDSLARMLIKDSDNDSDSGFQ